MNTKKILLLLLSIILAFSAIFSLAACGETTPPACTEHIDENGDGKCDNEGCGETLEKPETPGGEDSSEYFNENGELILYKGGFPTFQLVVGVGPQGDSEIDNLAATLSGLGNSEVKVVMGTTTEDAQTVEIIFGTVSNRGDEYKFDIHTLGLEGYIVKQVGTKIFVIAGSGKFYSPAIQYLKSTVFGLKKQNPDFVDLVMSADKNLEKIQDNYAVKDVTLSGTSIRGYTLAYDHSFPVARTVANGLRDKFYEKTGIWLPTSRFDKLDAGTPYIKIALIENDGEGGGFYFNIDKDKNATLECEFEAKFDTVVNSFFEERIFSDKIKGTVTLENFNPDYRNITYEQYGAVGDGETDDFFSIKAAHDDANANKLIVHATAGRTYYIGKENGENYITVKTDTYWHGCSFIFDDEEIIAYGPNSTRGVPIFYLRPDEGSYSFSGGNNPPPVASLEKGQENIGWAPGHTAMLIIYNENVRHYIRHGPNADNGKPQHELIIVDKDGNVDPSTPIQWDYKTITKIEHYNVDDKPIEIRGEGDDGRLTKIETRYNNGPNAYLYYDRNIRIRRSNVTLSGIEHFYTNYIPYEDGGKGSPYSGFTQVQYCNNVVIENMIFECPETYYDVDTYEGRTSDPNGTNMGSYEINAENANNITWRNCSQSNFFKPDGSWTFEGMMGTNFCKNLNFDNMFVCSFDAHCGVYNVTIKNTICDHLNFIGDGTIILEDVVIYAGGTSCRNTVANLRNDYGSIWAGDLYIDGLTFKIPQSYITSGAYNNDPLCLAKGEFNNHFFGYECSLPQIITVKNILVETVGYYVEGPGNGTNNRKETHIGYNQAPIYVFSRNINDDSRDISHPTFGIVGGASNINPTKPTVAINYYTQYTGEYAKLGINNKLNLVMPTSPTFKNTQKNIINDEE